MFCPKLAKSVDLSQIYHKSYMADAVLWNTVHNHNLRKIKIDLVANIATSLRRLWQGKEKTDVGRRPGSEQSDARVHQLTTTNTRALLTTNTSKNSNEEDFDNDDVSSVISSVSHSCSSRASDNPANHSCKYAFINVN